MPTLPALLAPQHLAQALELNPELRILDVRTAGEHENAHIAGSYNVPLDTLGEHAREIQTQVATPIVLVCQSGSRARRAENTLKAAGMPNLHVLEGGMNAWLAAGLPARRTRPRMSLERQVRIAAGSLVATGAILALTVHSWFALIPALMGSGLVFAGITDTCTLGMLLTRLPYNRPASCDVGAMVAALKAGLIPTQVRGSQELKPASAPSCTQ